MQKLGGTKALTSRVSKLVRGNATKLFGSLFSHPLQVCYYWFQV